MSASNLPPGVTEIDVSNFDGEATSAKTIAVLSAELARVTEEAKCNADDRAYWRAVAANHGDSAIRATEERDGLSDELAQVRAELARYKEMHADDIEYIDRVQTWAAVEKSAVHVRDEQLSAVRHDLARVTEERDDAQMESARLMAALEAVTEVALALMDEREKLNEIRSALDRRNLCYACAEPREDHTDDCAVCVGTMCVSCCSDSASGRMPPATIACSTCGEQTGIWRRECQHCGV